MVTVGLLGKIMKISSLFRAHLRLSCSICCMELERVRPCGAGGPVGRCHVVVLFTWSTKKILPWLSIRASQSEKQFIKSRRLTASGHMAAKLNAEPSYELTFTFSFFWHLRRSDQKTDINKTCKQKEIQTTQNIRCIQTHTLTGRQRLVYTLISVDVVTHRWKRADRMTVDMGTWAKGETMNVTKLLLKQPTIIFKVYILKIQIYLNAKSRNTFLSICFCCNLLWTCRPRLLRWLWLLTFLFFSHAPCSLQAQPPHTDFLDLTLVTSRRGFSSSFWDSSFPTPFIVYSLIVKWCAGFYISPWIYGCLCSLLCILQKITNRKNQVHDKVMFILGYQVSMWFILT